MAGNDHEAGVKGAMRTLDLLEAFGREGRALKLTQLARLLGVPVSSCHQLVGTLEARGYLYSFGRHKEIYPSGKILGVARALVAHDPWLRSTAPFLQALRDRTRETVILGKRQGHRAIYLAVEEGPEPVRFTARVGDRKPLHVSAIGRGLLAGMEDRALAAMLETLSARYPAAVPGFDATSFAAELRRGQKRGWHIQRSPPAIDVQAISAAFAIADDVAAISVAGPRPRVARAQARIIEELLRTRDAIQAMLDQRGTLETASEAA